MRELGLEAYRFSVSWPRIQAHGVGEANSQGLAFYDRLVDALLEAGVAPFLTLYHWDLPQALQDRGGWGNRDIAERFADYAAIVAKALGDRVRYFTTLNEPWMFAIVGNLLGQHAPGKRNPWVAARVVHNAVLAHDRAVVAIRATAPNAEVGISLSLDPVEPASEAPRDIEAARKADLFMNRWLLDPLLRGAYTDELRAILGPFFPRVRQADEDLMRGSKLDFLGINTYTREKARYAKEIPFFHFWTDAGDIPDTEFARDGALFTSMGSEVYPPALGLVLKRLRDEYGNPPVFVTENGAAFSDRPSEGRVKDPKRVAFIDGYLAEAARALEEGCDLRGYFYWSLFDNFEWAYGYDKQLGLVYVDYETEERIVKDSGRHYAAIIAAHRAAASAKAEVHHIPLD
jgi:beta-glucosidase